jgi:hypothetical protein
LFWGRKRGVGGSGRIGKWIRHSRSQSGRIQAGKLIGSKLKAYRPAGPTPISNPWYGIHVDELRIGDVVDFEYIHE